uniref:exodeoxyribonuclease III n=1 Tax=Paramormyrops kingsleyae TaxID=1676925 RepID=A0A3B3RTW2_9TELE|nr:uncharacterized protein LOC111845881 [Paramormyrops kingsleyae]
MAGRTTEQERPLHILNVNINGLKENGNKLFKEPERSENEVDVVLLTETHIGENDTLENYENDWRLFFTRYNSKSKGAAILVNKKRDFRPLDEIVDESGNYVIVSCWISGTFCTFVSVYHHQEETGLLKKLSEKIKPLYTDILVVGGDFNTALDEEEDTTSQSDNDDHIRIRKELLPFMDEHDLIDAWREKHPDDREYTYKYQRNHVMYYSRLDYIFINAKKKKLIHDCKHNNYISDHRPVSLFLDLKDQTRELKILSCRVQDLPSDKDLAELCPDIILLTKGPAENEEYIKKLKEEEQREEERWNVLWSSQSNAAILVAERQRDIHILFTVYHEDYVILHCIVFGRLHTFVSVCHPKGTRKNVQDMLQEITPSYSGTKVIGGIFSIKKKINKTLIEDHSFQKLVDESRKLPFLIHPHLGKTYKIEKQISYFSLILPNINPQNVNNFIQSLGQLKIHRCFSAVTKQY